MVNSSQNILKTACFFLLFMLSGSLMGGVGKISGTITDEASGEPIIGVNVIVHELGIGASTDIDGRYIILNIPVGYYTVSASFIGYNTIRISEIRCASDHTTIQDFGLSSGILEGEAVVVVAKRPLVQKDLTATQRITSSEEMKAMPVESFLGILTTQAGVNTGADGAIHIRGGRSNEVGFYIDGISVADPFFTNSLSLSVSNNALEEMKVVSGAFNAEYGNAMSGIVNISLKEGSDKFKGNLSFYTGDYISNNNELFVNIDDVAPTANSVIEGTLTGPIWRNKLTFNFSGKYRNNEGYRYGIRQHLPTDSSNFTDSDNWYVEVNGDSAFVPMNPSYGLNSLAKFTFRVTPTFKISVQSMYDKSFRKDYVHSYKFNPDGIYQYNSQNGGTSLRFNQSFGLTFYEFSLYRNYTNYTKYVYEDPLDSRYAPSNRVIGSPSSSTFVFGGTQMDDYIDRWSKTYGAKFDLTMQIGQHNETKTGLDFRYNDLEADVFEILYDNQEYREPTVLEANESPSHTLYTGQATFFSAYIQDKLEYESMIMNVGIRYDYFDPNDSIPVNLLDPTGEYTDAEIKTSISPRLGVAFPITDKGVLHFSYGHFYQMPSLIRLYSYDGFGAGIVPTIGYADLKPEKTVLYEFGLQQQFGEYIALEATAFYKDIRDLLASQSIYYESSIYGPSNYSVYLNKDYGTVKGFTLSLAKPYDRNSHLAGHFDYTYQTSEGNDVRDGSFYFSQFNETEEPKEIVVLGWDQTHLINATVTYSVPQKWGISIIGKLASGWPYTPIIPLANYTPLALSERKPWQKNVNIRAHKAVVLGGFEFTLFAKVFNVFDTKNERYVYDDTGRSGYTFVNQSTQETKEFISHYGEPGIHTWSEYQIRPNYYSSPRSVSLGFSMEF